MMATAILGSEEEKDPVEDLFAEELPFDFFIRLTIPRRSDNGYFQASRLKSSCDRESALLERRKNTYAEVRDRA